VSLKLPLAPPAYDKGDQARLRGAVERADQQNRKRQEDLVLAPSQRLVFYDEHGAEQHFTGAILGGLVRSDTDAQALSPAEQANARANIAAGTITGAPGGSNGQIQFNRSGAFGGFTLGGDASLNVLTGGLTLSAVNADTGTFGDGTHVARFAVDAKGRVTGATAVAIDVVAALGYTPLDAASSSFVHNLGGAPSVQAGAHASRPAAGTSGALYIETDTQTIWRDNGSGWDGIGSGTWGFAFEKDLSGAAAGIALVDFCSAVAWTIKAEMALCSVYLSDDGIAPSVQTDFDLHVGGVTKGTIRFAASATSATFSMASDTAVAANAKVQIYPPSNLNGMTGRIYGSIMGPR